ncbi:MAG: hypothetical protein ABI647_03065 [Gemmatimonadota bacterium]
MTIPGGRLQFFALEAADYLERLGLIVGRHSSPDGDELVRLTRALRGAALMAGPAAFAHAAASLEQFAKAYRDGGVRWDSDRAKIAADATEEFKRLVRRAATWDDEDTHAAEQLSESLNEALLLAGVAATEPKAPRESASGLAPSIRAFVAREAALVAGTLEHAAQAIDRLQVTDAFESVLRRLQPLRGVGSLPNLVPLPELLDAVELVISDLRDGRPSPPGASRGLRAAGAALSRLAQDVRDRGRPDPTAPEPAEVGGTLLAIFGREDDVVPIESLFGAGDQAPVVTRGAPRSTGEQSGDRTIELVSVADRLRQASDQLGAAGSSAAQDLQLFALLHQVRALDRAGSPSHPLSELFAAIRDAVAEERARADHVAFAGLLRRSADTIAVAAQAHATAQLPAELEPIAGRLRALGAEAKPPVVAAGLDLALDDSEIVPIESLLFSSPAPSVTAPPEWNAFERSFSTLHRLQHEPVAIETLLAEPPGARPIADTAPESDVVAIETLLYRGRRALERASTVRAALVEQLNQHHRLDHLDPLLLELMDLVPLALAD